MGLAERKPRLLVELPAGSPGGAQVGRVVAEFDAARSRRLLDVVARLLGDERAEEPPTRARGRGEGRLMIPILPACRQDGVGAVQSFVGDARLVTLAAVVADGRIARRVGRAGGRAAPRPRRDAGAVAGAIAPTWPCSCERHSRGRDEPTSAGGEDLRGASAGRGGARRGTGGAEEQSDLGPPPGARRARAEMTSGRRRDRAARHGPRARGSTSPRRSSWQSPCGSAPSRAAARGRGTSTSSPCPRARRASPRSRGPTVLPRRTARGTRAAPRAGTRGRRRRRGHRRGRVAGSGSDPVTRRELFVPRSASTALRSAVLRTNGHGSVPARSRGSAFHTAPQVSCQASSASAGSPSIRRRSRMTRWPWVSIRASRRSKSRSPATPRVRKAWRGGFTPG